MQKDNTILAYRHSQTTRFLPTYTSLLSPASHQGIGMPFRLFHAMELSILQSLRSECHPFTWLPHTASLIGSGPSLSEENLPKMYVLRLVSTLDFHGKSIQNPIDTWPDKA